MSKKKGNDYQKVCLFCENASVIAGDENVLCRFQGVVSEDHVCRKYVYDPLKRKPVTRPVQELDKDELL